MEVRLVGHHRGPADLDVLFITHTAGGAPTAQGPETDPALPQAWVYLPSQGGGSGSEEGALVACGSATGM